MATARWEKRSKNRFRVRWDEYVEDDGRRRVERSRTVTTRVAANELVVKIQRAFDITGYWSLGTLRGSSVWPGSGRGVETVCLSLGGHVVRLSGAAMAVADGQW